MAYLVKLQVENSGALESLDVDLPFSANGLPKPIVFVGENGSGKTTALSFIVDSMLQIAASKFGDVLAHKGLGGLFFRVRSADVRLGHRYSIAYARYQHEAHVCHYFDWTGDLTGVDFQQKFGAIPGGPTNASGKNVIGNEDEIAQRMWQRAFLYFPSGRRESPHWLQREAIEEESYSIGEHFGNRFGRKIVAEEMYEDTARWILDGLVDQAAGYPINGVSLANQILRIILDDPTAHFAIAPRSVRPRIQIYTGIDNERRAKIPSLKHLSAGQAMLLSLFATIANSGTQHANVAFNDIEGVVVIDEIEVYLHTQLQRKALPQLLRLFPKVQFIVTSHSPTFLMGMSDEYGSEAFEIRSMPTGEIIDVDQFNEIGEAVDALRDSLAFKTHVNREVKQIENGPMLIVEGPSDEKILSWAWRVVYGEDIPVRILSANSCNRLQFLLQDRSFQDGISEHQKVLGLFDFDDAFDKWNSCRGQGYPNETGDETSGCLLKHADKNIYAGLLPVPDHRQQAASKLFGGLSAFSMELYLPDEFLAEGSHLEHVAYPGGSTIAKFSGRKVPFAESLTQHPDKAECFRPVLELVRRTLC